VEYVKQKFNINITDDSIENIEEIDEFSTEEKTRFSINRRELKKSCVMRSSESHIRDNQNNTLDISLNVLNDFEETAKISYKFISRADRELAAKKINQHVHVNGQGQANSHLPSSSINLSKNILQRDSICSTTERYYWFAAYDKLINTKYFLKILKYFSTGEDENINHNKEILKEQAIILKDFEIFFDLNSNSTKPYIIFKKANIFIIF
jgi:hypothetical protein